MCQNHLIAVPLFGGKVNRGILPQRIESIRARQEYSSKAMNNGRRNSNRRQPKGSLQEIDALRPRIQGLPLFLRSRRKRAQSASLRARRACLNALLGAMADPPCPHARCSVGLPRLGKVLLSLATQGDSIPGVEDGTQLREHQKTRCRTPLAPTGFLVTHKGGFNSVLNEDPPARDQPTGR